MVAPWPLRNVLGWVNWKEAFKKIYMSKRQRKHLEMISFLKLMF